MVLSSFYEISRLDTIPEDSRLSLPANAISQQNFDESDKLTAKRNGHNQSHDILEFAKRRPRVSLAVVVCIVAFLAFHSVYIPLPETIAHRELMTFIELVLRATYIKPVQFLSSFGPMHQMLYTRFVMDTFARILAAAHWHDRDMTVFNSYISGVPVRVYDPFVRDNDAMIIFIHGGGFVIGETVGYDVILRDIVSKAKMVAVSIEYRRAPEYRFPAQIEDVEAVIRGVMGHAHLAYNVNPKNIILMGDSAGGNLVAVMTQRFAKYRRQGEDLPEFKGQVLFYPLLQYFDFRTGSYQQYYNEYHGTGFLDPAAIARAFLVYVGGELSEEMVQHVLHNRHSGKSYLDSHSWRMSHGRLPPEYTTDKHYYTYANDWHQSEPDQHAHKHLIDLNTANPDITPLLGDLTDLPPALIATCEFDVLRDEGYLYARALGEAGNDVQYTMHKGAVHAMLNLTKLPIAQKMINEAVEFARKMAFRS